MWEANVFAVSVISLYLSYENQWFSTKVSIGHLRLIAIYTAVTKIADSNHVHTIIGVQLLLIHNVFVVKLVLAIVNK